MSRSLPPHPPHPDDDQGGESHDPVWDLLGRARPIHPRPSFVRRVLTAIEKEPSARADRWSWLRPLFAPSLRPALALGVIALLTLGYGVFRPARPGQIVHASASKPEVVVPAPAEDAADEMLQALASEIALLEEVGHLLDPEDGLDLDDEDVGRLLF